MQDAKIEDNMNLPLREVVFLKLRQAILQGEMQPGERLMEIQLANMLGVSRTPVREAIRKLELEGLVKMIPRRGAEVASITEKDMRDVLEVRTTLEDLAVALACERISKSQVIQLKEANKLFDKAVESGDVFGIVDADVRFHDIIYKSTNNLRLMQMLNNLREQLYRYRLEYIKNESSHKTLIKEHNKLIEYIENGDKEKAGELIREHITNQEKDIERTISEG